MNSLLVCLIALFGLLSGFNALPIQQNPHHPNIIEGDILVTESLKQLMTNKHRIRRGITTKLIKRWPKNVVPYVVDASLGKLARRAIRHAIREYHQHTCIQFIHRTDEKDYVAFERDIGCYSPIGRQGGRQKLAVGDGCEQKGTIMHELMHALGFFHEQSRYDRDKYIKILWWNIEPDFFKNFESYSHEDVDTQDIPYDYGSLMHYDKLAFSKNRQNTIEALDNADRPLGQMEKFSDKDIQQLLKAYKCRSIDKDPLPAQPLRQQIKENVQLTTLQPDVTDSTSTTWVSEKTTAHPPVVKENKPVQTQTIHTFSEEKGVYGKGSETNPKGKCKDIYPVSCKEFASYDGYCQYWKSFMQKTCPFSCGFCK